MYKWIGFVTGEHLKKTKYFFVNILKSLFRVQQCCSIKRQVLVDLVVDTLLFKLFKMNSCCAG